MAYARFCFCAIVDVLERSQQEGQERREGAADEMLVVPVDPVVLLIHHGLVSGYAIRARDFLISLFTEDSLSCS